MKTKPGTSRKQGPPKRNATGTSRASGRAASLHIDQRIRDLGGWRGKTLARMRALILAADPEMTEEWKWMGTPVWSHHGNVCTGEAYTKVVKLTFARGASIPDPSGLFNSSLEGNTRRAIDIHEGERVDAVAFRKLVKAAVARNAGSAKTGAKARPRANKATGLKGRKGARTAVVPQLAVWVKQAAALPGWFPGRPS